MFQDLLGIPQLDPSQSFESLNEEEKETIAGSTRGPPSVTPLHSQEDSLQQSSTPSRSLLPGVGRSPEMSSYFDDMALTSVSFLSFFKTKKWCHNQAMFPVVFVSNSLTVCFFFVVLSTDNNSLPQSKIENKNFLEGSGAEGGVVLLSRICVIFRMSTSEMLFSDLYSA